MVISTSLPIPFGIEVLMSTMGTLNKMDPYFDSRSFAKDFVITFTPDPQSKITPLESFIAHANIHLGNIFICTLCCILNMVMLQGICFMSLFISFVMVAIHYLNTSSLNLGHNSSIALSVTLQSNNRSRASFYSWLDLNFFFFSSLFLCSQVFSYNLELSNMPFFLVSRHILLEYLASSCSCVQDCWVLDLDGPLFIKGFSSLLFLGISALMFFKINSSLSKSRFL